MAKPGRPPAPPDLPGREGGLGQKIEETIERVLHWLTITLMETISGWIGWAFELFMHALRPGMLAVFGPFLRFFRDMEGTPPEFRTLINDTLTEEGEAGAAILGMVGSSVVGAGIGSVTGSLFSPLTYAVNRNIKPARADPAMAIANKWRHDLSWDEVNAHTGDRGWEIGYIRQIAETMRPRPDILSILMLWRRGKMPENVLNDKLSARGYTDSDIARLKQATEIIPGPADLISMAVREAWRDDIAARWGYDADFPPEFAEWMQKQGDVDGWAQKYWRAHWTLPGLTTVLEILHREDDFTLGDLDTFLRVSDIPSAWREYIKKVAYVPLTRVDVRRMYGLGVLTTDEVKRNYLDLGYNDRDAERMTEFTVRYETDEDREATKTDILSFYKVGALSESEAQAWLVSIGYPDDLASYLVSREATKIEQSAVDAQVKYIKDLYIHRELSLSDAHARLTALGIPGSQIDQSIDMWTLDREAKIQRPSRATLDKHFRQDVITETGYKTGLDALGYQAQYVGQYLQSVLLDKTEAARKEQEAARKEQEDIRKRKVKSDYQIAAAGLDVDIAELQTAVADTQLALQTRRLRYGEALRIAQEAPAIAGLRERAAEDIAGISIRVDKLQEVALTLDGQIEVLETQIADIRLRATPAVTEFTAAEAEVAIREREVRVKELQADIEGVQTEIADIRLRATPTVTEFTAVEAEVAIREREVRVKELQADIEGVQTEIADIRMRATPAVTEFTAVEAEVAIREREVRVKELQVDIEGVQTEIADIRLRATPTVTEFTAPEARVAIGEREAQIRELQVGVEGIQSEIVDIRLQMMGEAPELTVAEAEIALVGRDQAVERLQDSIDNLSAEIAEIRSESAVTTAELLESEAKIAIKERNLAIERLQDSIAVLDVEIAEIRRESAVAVAELSAEEAEVAIRERNLAIERFQDSIATLDVEIAEIRRESAVTVAELSVEEAEVAIRERNLAVERLQDSIATLNVEIAEIRRVSAITVTELSSEEAEVAIRERRLAIELAQDDIAALRSQIAGLHTAITEREAVLLSDIALAERVVTLDQIEAEYREDERVMIARLGELRRNLAMLREQKAQLKVEYRVGLVA